MFLTKLLISFHEVQFVNPYANCELPLSKTTKTDRKEKISKFYPIKYSLYVKVMLKFYLSYLPLS
nr:MAG TPA: hypothetical protein [Microviridae sp.]